jgi:hypothetical protein
MKTFIVILGLAIVGFLCVFMYGSAVAERNARFIHVMNDLKQAHMELQLHGPFTNRFRTSDVYPFTNRIDILGTNYHCEFAAQSEDFRGKGFLTITTNQVFIWIDKKLGATRLKTGPLELPSGF